jgi:hypothetical protein
VHAGGGASTRPALQSQALAAWLHREGAQPGDGAAHYSTAGASTAGLGPEVSQRRGGHSGAHGCRLVSFRGVVRLDKRRLPVSLHLGATDAAHCAGA